MTFVGSVQADKQFDNETPLAEAAGSEPPGAPAGPAKLGEVATELVARHRLWLHRKTPAGKKKAFWKPVKRYRVATKKLLRSVDHQLRHGTTTGGLVFFKFKEDDELWAAEHRDRWPYLLMAADCGPDNISGQNAMERHFDLNTDMLGDWSHGASRDIFMALGHVDLKQL